MKEANRFLCPGFSLAQTIESGQCFRWKKWEEGRYTVLSGARQVTLAQAGDSILFLDEVSEGEAAYWRNYFDWDRDYEQIKKELSAKDQVMAMTIPAGSGIHILRQEFFETLMGFIISQNNHIPRIKGIMERICQSCGEEIGAGVYSFPTPEQLATVTEEEFRWLGAGFRARYLVDAVGKVVSGQIREEDLRQMETAEAKAALMTICGVGEKVADCVLLFGLGRWEVFPTDVWIRRMMEQLYFRGKEASLKEIQKKAEKKFGAYRGLAQQYLFYYGREGQGHGGRRKADDKDKRHAAAGSGGNCLPDSGI
ncbi:DNA-3-methyladenine glycosylase 2 family protein [Anaerotignum lactatifermentans]|uniref:DNA-(apurinic or apyrimidinic site) lyase n=1 Tax=Anaerotignum lactatifermentans TaxID=160404 RepID=A0ABS2GBG9_9FIRM|nr:DNA glycosylase [Anaerotignum lactatifermentans]MBM6829838.1 DNA-3-methyladenine glycosylase 2 family protein [Anaerotignum lactatifermentans]MBM6878222.1 DNA-3-methyladenine glycosylase 2 family protein [Anaerotignum lactatifermentans]MBM6951302.1 DNA-3-methyladenine glycosylase 2 family protein [Anaerotignum lactatifermentans]